MPIFIFIFISVIERRICHASPTMAAREIRCTWWIKKEVVDVRDTP